MKPHSFNKRAKVPIPADQWYATIDTALCDQRVTQSRLATLC